MMKTIGNRNISITARDVKEMWKACRKAKKRGDGSLFEAAVTRVVEKATCKAISPENAKQIASDVKKNVEEYGSTRNEFVEQRASGTAQIVGGVIAVACGIACWIAGKEFIDAMLAGANNGLKAFAAMFVGAPAGLGLGIYLALKGINNVISGAEGLASSAEGVVLATQKAICERLE